jgi:glycosyltransferase involved in cell wall biosynthesis
MTKKLVIPLVSIGMPVYNGEATISAAIESVLCQTLDNFELIISDNCSTDRTEEICRNYAENDCRIRYIRQKKNIGAQLNFNYVLSEAQAKYFTWAAADDVRSANFLCVNIGFLEKNPEFTASTSPNCFSADVSQPDAHVNFSILGSESQRVISFLNHCWKSHGIFYSVMRTNLLRTYGRFNEYFLAFDWAIALHLASQGPINRANRGLLVLGEHGASSRPDIWKLSRQRRIEFLLPLYQFTLFTVKCSNHLMFAEKIEVWNILLHINMCATRQMIWSEIAKVYAKHFRPYLVTLGLKK